MSIPHPSLGPGSDAAAAPLLLIADHHDVTRAFLADNLMADGHRVATAADLTSTRGKLRVGGGIALLIADLAEDTLPLLDAIRHTDERLEPTLPVIALTGNHDKVHRVRLLERGADDLLLKPFSYPELRARVSNLLTRTARRPLTVTVGSLTIDPTRRSVTVSGTSVLLTAREYDVLLTLASDPQRTFTREELMHAVWGFRGERTRALDSTCSRLRAKLGHSGASYIHNVWGVGYRLVTPQPTTHRMQAA